VAVSVSVDAGAIAVFGYYLKGLGEAVVAGRTVVVCGAQLEARLTHVSGHALARRQARFDLRRTLLPTAAVLEGKGRCFRAFLFEAGPQLLDAHLGFGSPRLVAVGPAPPVAHFAFGCAVVGGAAVLGAGVPGFALVNQVGAVLLAAG